jgi:5'-methylthioadenosine phosphorylase
MSDRNELPRADVGVFGGSGFYSFAEAPTETVTVATPWGEPSAPVTIANVPGDDGSDVKVAFLPRHGLHHQYPPHQVNYRANVETMRLLGVRALIAPFAAGSLQPEVKPSQFVVVDQLVDRTYGRPSTFYDRFEDGPAHTPFAEPYDERLRGVAVATARDLGIEVHDGGTVVVVNGPRFSTRAESAWHRSAGWHVVNMTQCPEAPLAAEAGIPFVGIALVTDYDAGLTEDPEVEPVTQEQVFAVFKDNLDRVRDLILTAAPRIAAVIP